MASKTITRSQYVEALEALGLNPHTVSQLVVSGTSVSVRTIVTGEDGRADLVYGQFHITDDVLTVVDDPPAEAS
ncbi:hypothetical protein [Litorihabitans aurantiacus]|uniref:Uncharacterized protein n=1 Tax=Litorihabitans aurantiacus TaxID=1930061 RepID=A0AA38CSP7_9MICO|nr:hypothetical protein [Litorihabitans aurantiacus]GMA31614.1 hypothetical protein GCM10025875_16060 [Litorihabitans aurantiacus]